MEHFDTIHESPSHIYHSALPFSPSSSWLQKCYSTELLSEVKIVKGLPTEWGKCFRTVHFDEHPWALSYWNDTAAVGMLFGGILLLDTITGSCTTTLSGHTDWVRSVVFSSDGACLLSGSDDKTIKLWDTQTGGMIKTFLGHTEAVFSVSFSADSTMIASGSKDMTIMLWNFQTGECCCIIKQQEPVVHVNFFPTNPQHLMAISGGKVWQWDTNGYQIGKTYDGSHIAFSLDGAHFALCNHSGVTVQNSESSEIMAKFAMPHVTHCCFSPDGRLVAAAADTTIYIWDTASTNLYPTERFTGHTHFITGLAFSSHSSLISVSDDGSVKFWQMGTPSVGTVKTKPESVTNHSSSVTITLQAKDNILLTCDTNGLVKIWDISTELCRASYKTPARGSNMRDTQLVGRRLILVWQTEKNTNIWDTEKKELLKIASSYSSIKNLRDLRISGDGSKVFLCCTEYFEVFSIETGEVMDRVMFEWVGSKPFLILDGSRVWVTTFTSEWQGWDFGVPESLPIKIPPCKLHPNGKILWDTCSSKVQDGVAGNVLFQLPMGLGKPDDVQWNDKNLVVLFKPGRVFILDFSHIFSK